MQTYTTDAIVLKRWNLGEADRVHVLYTADRGRVSALARGSRKLTSKVGGHLELFSVSQLTLREGNAFDLITSAELTEPHSALSHSVERTHAAHYVAEAVLKLTVEAVLVDRLFDLLRATFGYLTQAEHPAGILAGFQLKLLTILGHQPVLDRCVHCSNDFHSNNRELPTANREFKQIAGFDLIHGGLVCVDDAARDGAKLMPCSEIARALLVTILTEPMATAHSDAPGFSEASRIIERALVTQTERPLKSRAFVELQPKVSLDFIARPRAAAIPILPADSSEIATLRSR